MKNSIYKRIKKKKKNYTKDKWPLWYRIVKLKKQYTIWTGHNINFKHPRTFFDKIQWYKLFYINEDMRRVVDKVEFKNYIQEKLGSPDYTAKLYRVWSDIDSFVKDWDDLPEQFFLKSNVCSDDKFVKRIDKSKTTAEEQAAIFSKAFNKRKTLINSFCSAYYGTKPLLFAEEALCSSGNATDYKVFCFNGEPFCFYIDTAEFLEDGTKKSFLSFYDLSWNKLDARYLFDNAFDYSKPTHLGEMIEIAKELSSSFPFARIDFYDTQDGPLLGEITLYPGNGFHSYEPPEFDKQLMDLFVLPEPNVKMSKLLKWIVLG